MPYSSNSSTQVPTSAANNAGFGTKISEARIASYMWYIHVTVRVNAADRLRYSIAHLLGQGTTTTTAPASSSFSGFVDIESAGSGTLGHGGKPGGGCTANMIDNLTDYLVLHHFSWAMLETLVNTAPIEQHAGGYAVVLAGIPAHFREEFCRRLYCLLFSKYIVEWPQGIEAPEPAPGSMAAAAAAAATAAGRTGSETTANEHENSSVQSSQEEDEDDDTDDESMSHILSNIERTFTDDEDNDIIIVDKNDTHAGDKNENLPNTCPTTPDRQSTPGPSSPCADLPSPGYNPELAQAVLFGTVSDPQPIQYRGGWARNSMYDGTARAASCAKAKADAEEVEYGVAGYACEAADAAAGGRGASHVEIPLWAPRTSPRHQNQHQQAPPPPPPPPQHATTLQGDRPSSASLLGSSSEHSRASHTGSCWPCRGREPWSHGVGAQR